MTGQPMVIALGIATAAVGPLYTLAGIKTEQTARLPTIEATTATAAAGPCPHQEPTLLCSLVEAHRRRPC
jgi:multisubunit Na+/H+ antiporter MnhC subunit